MYFSRQQGMDDAASGRSRRIFFSTKAEEEEYNKGYLTGSYYSYLSENLVGAGRAIGEMFANEIIPRMVYLLPAVLLTVLAIFLGLLGESINDFLNDFRRHALHFLIFSVVILAPVAYVCRRIYQYYRGVDFGYYIFKKEDNRLYYGLRIYTVVATALPIILIMSFLSWAGPSDWILVKLVLQAAGAWYGLEISTNFHWNYDKSIRLFTESAAFKVGLNDVMDDESLKVSREDLEKILANKPDFVGIDRSTQVKAYICAFLLAVIVWGCMAVVLPSR